ncbi:MAG: ornithine--oxo-acid transaminase [Promethearchaeota archaeon]
MTSSQDFIEMDFKYGAHNYKPLPVVISKARGCWVYDVEGNKYLDCLSAYSSHNLGHCNPEIIRAMEEQAHKVTLTSRAFHNDRMGLFLKMLCEIMSNRIQNTSCSPVMALPMNTGAEAVETALKTCRAWAYIKKGIPKGKAVIITCSGNFHGRTITIVSFSTDIENGQYHGNFSPFTPGFENVPFGDADALAEKIKEIGEDRVAGFLFEPIQGEAGVIIPPNGYLKKVRDICTDHGILMMADEIQTGLCRTGKVIACEHKNIKPDILILGKALGGGVYPVSAIVTTGEIVGPEVIKPGVHGSTFGGNPLAAAIGMKSLELLIKNKLHERAAILGDYFLSGLKRIQGKCEKYPMREVRGRGLLIAIEFDCQARPIAEKLMNAGILAKDTHDKIIRFAPPLIITKEEISWALKTIESVLA